MQIIIYYNLHLWDFCPKLVVIKTDSLITLMEKGGDLQRGKEKIQLNVN